YEARRQRRMRQDAKQRVAGDQPARLKPDQGERKSDGRRNDADREIDPQQDAERHPEKTRVRKRVAEEGHPSPYDEAADGGGEQRHSRSGKQRTQEERLSEHGHHAVGLSSPRPESLREHGRDRGDRPRAPVRHPARTASRTPDGPRRQPA